MQANKPGVPLPGRTGRTSQACLFTLKQWRWEKPSDAAAEEGRTKNSSSRLPEPAAAAPSSALGGKGQKPCYKLHVQRSALLSKKLASKVLIGPPKINPFNE